MEILRDFRPIEVNFAPDLRDPAVLENVIQLLSGRKLQPNGVIALLSSNELVKAWDTLKATGAPEIGEPAGAKP